MKAWYLRQTPRDQYIVLAVAAVSVLVMLYALAIHPLMSGLENRRLSIAAKQETLAWMLDSAAKVQQLGGATARPQNTSNKAAYVLLDEAIRAAGLNGAADRVEPAGRDKKGARAQFSQVDFDKLVRMLGSLQSQYGLTVSIANISRKPGGLVSARITLENS